MPNLPLSSNACAYCRIEPRTVAAGRVAPALLAALALLSLFLSALPMPACGVLAALVAGQGWWRWRRKCAQVHVFELSLAGIHVDGRIVDAFELHRRGALAVLQWTIDARRQHCIAWPGMIDATELRELRLAANRMASAGTASLLAP